MGWHLSCPGLCQIVKRVADYLGLQPANPVEPPGLFEAPKKLTSTLAGVVNRSDMELEKLISRLDKPLVTGTLARDVTSICYDSRQVAPGSFFCAIEGNRVDGHAFIEQAVERGATAVVSQKPHLTTRATHIQVQDSRDALARLAATFYDTHPPDCRWWG